MDEMTPTERSGCGSSSIPGVESVTVGGGSVTVVRAEDTERFGAELCKPDNELTGKARFPPVERELNVSVGQMTGDCTLIVYDDGEEAGRRTLTRSFEIVDGSIDDEGFLGLRVRNTGDVIFSPERIELIQSTGAEGFEHEYTDTSLSGVRQPIETRAYGVNSLDFVSTDSDTSPSACDWRLNMQYEITVTGGSSATADVTVEYGGEYREEPVGGEDTDVCQKADIIAFEEGPRGE